MNNSDMPAMPVSVSATGQGEMMTTDDYGVGMGLTKLEDFTKSAMHALLSNPGAIDNLTNTQLASKALHAAKAQLAALEQSK